MLIRYGTALQIHSLSSSSCPGQWNRWRSVSERQRERPHAHAPEIAPARPRRSWARHNLRILHAEALRASVPRPRMLWPQCHSESLTIPAWKAVLWRIGLFGSGEVQSLRSHVAHRSQAIRRSRSRFNPVDSDTSKPQAQAAMLNQARGPGRDILGS
jgi:hypothetical protein